MMVQHRYRYDGKNWYKITVSPFTNEICNIPPKQELLKTISVLYHLDCPRIEGEITVNIFNNLHYWYNDKWNEIKID